MRVYLDNAATSFPKPNEVYSSVLNYMTNIGSNPGRGGYSNAIEGNKIVLNCRESLMNLFNFNKPENVIFTSNITHSLNLLLKSSIKNGWHIITSSMEHNAVIRPLTSLQKQKNIEVDILPCSPLGVIDINLFKKSIKSNTKLVVMSNASNIIGAIQPLEEIGEICKKNNIFFIIDSAQTAGLIEMDFNKLNCNALAFTGHKGLMAPQGIGGFIIDDTFNDQCSAFIEGGTGSISDSIIQPNFLPDKFESGTLNAPAICGLLEGVKYINKLGIDYITEKETSLTNRAINGLLNISGITVYAYDTSVPRCPVISFNSNKIDNSELGYLLDSKYGIMCRTGLHCAPLAHKTIGTFPQGTIRVSFNIFNENNDVDYFLDSLNKIVS